MTVMRTAQVHGMLPEKGIVVLLTSTRLQPSAMAWWSQGHGLGNAVRQTHSFECRGRRRNQTK